VSAKNYQQSFINSSRERVNNLASFAMPMMRYALLQACGIAQATTGRD